MNVETVSYSNDVQFSVEEIIKKIRSLDTSIDIQDRESIAGILIEAKSPDTNIPNVKIILTSINSEIILRLEIIGNITQYLVDEIVVYLQKNFNLSYLEVTDPKTGLIKFSLSKKDKDSDLFSIYKRELFKFHYPRDDGRLMVFYDQKTFWVHPVIKTPSINRPNILKKPIQPKELPKKVNIVTNQISPVKIKSKQPVADSGLELSNEITEEITEKEVIATTPEVSSPKRIAKVKLDLSQRELMILKLVESKPNKKVQSKGLRKELPSLDQDTIRNVLRSLVAKGLLYVRSAWYIVKEDPSEDTWDIASETPIEERLQNLTPKEKRIYEILENRPGYKAQARMLVKETKMTKDNLKKLLRNMVAKDVLYVYAAWYCIKE
jgi:DNA-binding MarR family transcriptional regulator